MFKNFYIKLYNQKGYNPCGTGHNWLSRGELKTTKGMINRINKGYYHIPVGVSKIEVYEYTDIYREETYKLVYVKLL